MGNKKINELEQTTDISDTDLLIIETENGTRSVSYEKIRESSLNESVVEETKETLTTLMSKVDTLVDKVNNLEWNPANTSALGSLIAIYTLLPSNTSTAGLKISGKCTITANGYLSNKNSNTSGWAFNEMYLSKLVVDGTTSNNVGHLYNTLIISANNNIEIESSNNSNDSTITVCIYGNKDDIININTINTSFPVWSVL